MNDFSVVAIVAAYNEADIIHHVIKHLLRQEVQVYFLDDGSTDGTAAIAESYVGRGVLQVEQLQARARPEPHSFDWEQILRRKVQLASELPGDWFIHQDADEFRDSPWPHASLRTAIQQVDALGFNAIDFALLDFWPTHHDFPRGADPREVLTHYAPPAPYDRLQIRCWKKTAAPIDLTATGGHEVRFSGRDVFPIQFPLRHYPIRGQAHGARKVFVERRARFLDAERARGWHVQYDGIAEGSSFVRNASSLIAFDEASVRRNLPVRERPQETLERLVMGLRSELEEQRTSREKSEAALETRAGQLAQARGDLDRARLDAAALRDDLARSRRDLDAVRAQVLTLDATANNLRREISELRQSLSWRITGPARAVFRLLTGRES